MRCTTSRTTLSSSSVLKVKRAWKFPSDPMMLHHQPLLGTTWHLRTTHRHLHGQQQNKIRQSAPCPSGSRIRAAGAWKSGRCNEMKDMTKFVSWVMRTTRQSSTLLHLRLRTRVQSRTLLCDPSTSPRPPPRSLQARTCLRRASSRYASPRPRPRRALRESGPGA
jgi:hypothetical protein